MLDYYPFRWDDFILEKNFPRRKNLIEYFQFPTGIKPLPLDILITIGFEQKINRILKYSRKFSRNVIVIFYASIFSWKIFFS